MRNVSIRLEDDEYADLTKRISEAGYTSLQEGGRRALLDHGLDVKGLEAQVPPALHHYMHTLAEVLSSGDQLAIMAVTANLDFFHVRLRRIAHKSR